MASDYKKNKNEKRIAYEEIVTACHEMESGISEMEAYRRFGERCGHVKYKNICNIIDPESSERQPPYGRNAGKRICGSLG